MPRRLTGSSFERGGRYVFSCPTARGQRSRVEAVFDSPTDRDRFAEAALAALNAGAPIPDAEVSAVGGRAPLPATDFTSVANAWYHDEHEVLPRAGAERSYAVRGLLDAHLLPWFGPRLAVSIEDINRRLVKQWLKEFLAAPRAEHASAGTAQPGDVAREVSLAEALPMVTCSRSTLRRRLEAGVFPNARYDERRGMQVVPVGDLVAAGLLDGARARQATGRGRSPAYAAMALQVLRQIVRYAAANGSSPVVECATICSVKNGLPCARR